MHPRPVPDISEFAEKRRRLGGNEAEAILRLHERGMQAPQAPALAQPQAGSGSAPEGSVDAPTT
eukprot:5402831-Heterocapsa_arctica.AAC.1